MNTDTTAPPANLAALHEDFREAAIETRGCYRAVSLLVRLLNSDKGLEFELTDREGMAVLLEAIRDRLELSVEGIGMTAQALGMPDAWELMH